MDIKEYTVEEFWVLAQQPQYRDRQVELRGYRLVDMAPSGLESSSISSTINFFLQGFNRVHDLGLVSGADGGYRLDGGTLLAPDVGFIRYDSLPDEYDRTTYVPVRPDLAVEVISPSDRPASIAEKTDLYLRAGTRLVWNVYPRRQTVEVFRLAAGEIITETLTPADTLSGAEVLPGFTLPVARIFT